MAQSVDPLFCAGLVGDEVEAGKQGGKAICLWGVGVTMCLERLNAFGSRWRMGKNWVCFR